MGLMHDHIPGFKPCPLGCGLRYCVDCAHCQTTHVRIHHPKRRHRRHKEFK